MPGLTDFFTTGPLMWLQAWWISKRDYRTPFLFIILCECCMEYISWITALKQQATRLFFFFFTLNFSKPVSLSTHGVLLSMQIRTAVLETFSLYCCLTVGLLHKERSITALAAPTRAFPPWGVQAWVQSWRFVTATGCALATHLHLFLAHLLTRLKQLMRL